MSVSRVAVIGAGPMGRLHARAVARRAASHGDCVLAHVIDRHLTRSAQVASEFGGKPGESLDTHPGEVDIAIVAVPPSSHAGVSSRLLEAGIDILIEKPMTSDPEAAKALVERAQTSGRVLGVGHVEWYNPVWRIALQAAGTPRRIDVERLNPPMERGLDLDVIQDFMLHDLDWVRRTNGGGIRRLEAHGRATLHDRFDEAEAEIEFVTGSVVRLRASRVAAERRRIVRIEGAHADVTADLLTGRVDGRPAPVTDEEPLDRQWADFLAACRDRTEPENSGRLGVETLVLVERVRAAAMAGS